MEVAGCAEGGRHACTVAPGSVAHIHPSADPLAEGLSLFRWASKEDMQDIHGVGDVKALQRAVFGACGGGRGKWLADWLIGWTDSVEALQFIRSFEPRVCLPVCLNGKRLVDAPARAVQPAPHSCVWMTRTSQLYTTNASHAVAEWPADIHQKLHQQDARARQNTFQPAVAADHPLNHHQNAIYVFRLSF